MDYSQSQIMLLIHASRKTQRTRDARDVASESRAVRVSRSLVFLLPKVWTNRSLKLFCLQFPMVVIATKSDIIKERECDSILIKKWAEAEKGIFISLSVV